MTTATVAGGAMHSMTETMRHEGHSGLVRTAAASNLDQMLVKLCQQDGMPIVNVVRKTEQEALLRSLGATYVCNSTSPSLSTDLVEPLKATSATITFDATGGGTLASQTLDGMEAAANSTAAEYSRYGSAVIVEKCVHSKRISGRCVAPLPRSSPP